MDGTRTLVNAPPIWLKQAGLALLSLAFVRVCLNALMSLYMANDDVAIMDHAPRVFAVR